jgi:hypothetical protein
MHRTTINISESVLQQAKIKAVREDVTVSEVMRDLLARWVAGEIDLSAREHTRETLVGLAREAHGMWAGRTGRPDEDSDAYLAASRAGLRKRDEELAHARLDA